MKQNPSMQSSEHENICINCPGSLWGEKSICRIHNKSIGGITYCEQWTRQNHNTFKVNEEQLSFIDLEPAMEIVQKTEEDLRGYHWMVKEVERLQRYIDKEIQSLGPGSRLISQYGLEASLPKGHGLKLGELTVSEKRFERQWRRLEKLKNKVKKIDAAADQIVDEKERTVLECILDGVRMNMIAAHIDVSRQRLNEIKRLIVKKMAWTLYEDKLKS